MAQHDKVIDFNRRETVFYRGAILTVLAGLAIALLLLYSDTRQKLEAEQKIRRTVEKERSDLAVFDYALGKVRTETPSGKLSVSGMDDGTVWLASKDRIWQKRLGIKVDKGYTFWKQPISERIIALALSPNERWLATGSNQGRVGLWDLHKFKFVGYLQSGLGQDDRLNRESKPRWWPMHALVFTFDSRFLFAASTHDGKPEIVLLWLSNMGKSDISQLEVSDLQKLRSLVEVACFCSSNRGLVVGKILSD